MINLPYLTTIIFLLSFLQLNAQNPDFSEYRKIDQYVKKTPDSLTNNVKNLHAYLTSGANTEEEELRAFYMWIITNIKYHDEIELLYHPYVLFYMGSNNCCSPMCVLKKKKAVCEGFSKLFHLLCHYSGFEAYSITGYISKKGILQDRATHSWNVVKINDEWRFFDLSWAGAALDHFGIKNKTNEFFMISPNEFIYTHLPLISMWQFLETPISMQVFNGGDAQIQEFINNSTPTYNYTDSLSSYNKLSHKEKKLKTAKDISKTNPSNKFNLAIEYYAYARLVLSFEGDIGPMEFYELINARKKINMAIQLFKSAKDISSKIMIMTCMDDLDRIQSRIDFASSYIKYLK